MVRTVICPQIDRYQCEMGAQNAPPLFCPADRPADRMEIALEKVDLVTFLCGMKIGRFKEGKAQVWDALKGGQKRRFLGAVFEPSRRFQKVQI